MKYVFGMRSILGDFDEVIIRPDDADRLQEVVDYLRRAKEKQELDCEARAAAHPSNN